MHELIRSENLKHVVGSLIHVKVHISKRKQREKEKH